MAAVGSSISTMRASERRVRAIATAWRCPPDICLTRSRGPRLGLEFLKQLRDPDEHGRIIEDPQGSDLALEFPSQEYVGGGREVVAEGEVLVDDFDAFGARVHGLMEVLHLTLDPDFAPRRPKVPGDYPHEGGLAGTVVAHEANHLARPDRKIDAFQRLDGAEMLGNALKLQQRHASSQDRP
jgi:hypothetical protein